MQGFFGVVGGDGVLFLGVVAVLYHAAKWVDAQVSPLGSVSSTDSVGFTVVILGYVLLGDGPKFLFALKNRRF